MLQVLQAGLLRDILREQSYSGWAGETSDYVEIVTF